MGPVGDMREVSALVRLRGIGVVVFAFATLALFAVPASGSANLVFQATLPNTAGSYTNSIVSHLIDTQVDSTIATTDDAPATSSVTVSAAPTSYTLAVSKAGTGSGAVTSSPAGISCGATCSASYTNGTSVTLTATAASGSTFSSWTGCDSVSGSTCTVTMSTAKSVSATFNTAPPSSYTLSVSKSGTGSGNVSSAPAGIDCGSTCSADFGEGTSVTLAATAATGSTLGSWTGCDSTSGNALDSGGDDTGWVPATADALWCTRGVGKSLAKLAQAALRCHAKMAYTFLAGRTFDEEACEEFDPLTGRGARDRYSMRALRLIAHGGCPSCLDDIQQEALAVRTIGQLDADNARLYPCP